jgi:hypothetical protein
MWKSFKSLVMVVALLVASNLQAQESTTYSRFGLGLLSENNFLPSRAMGGLGAAYSSNEGINYANPASYAKLDLIAFEGGITGGVNRVSSNFNKGKAGNVNLSYLAFSMPVKKNIWVTSFGLVPFSQKDYLVVDTASVSANSSVANIFEGSGTLYNIYWGNGFKYKDFSLGFNIGYLFGSLDATTLAVPLDEDGFSDPHAFATFERDKVNASGLTWNVGAMYSIPISQQELKKNELERFSLDIGLAYNAEYNMGGNTRLEASKYSVYNNLLTTKDEGESFTDFLDELLPAAAAGELDNVTGLDIDTFLAPSLTNVKLRMPTNVNVGFMFNKTFNSATVWKAGFDFKFTPWSNYTGYENGAGGQLSNSWRIAVGGEIFPLFLESKRNKTNKLLQLKYRAGFYYTKTPVTVQNTTINEFGINFGIAIPIRLKMYSDDGYLATRAVHPFSLGFEVGSRGTRRNDLIKDNFFRVNLGISLNDKWFVKSKYN